MTANPFKQRMSRKAVMVCKDHSSFAAFFYKSKGDQKQMQDKKIMNENEEFDLADVVEYARYSDIVKISWHIFLKGITDYAARSKVS